MKKRVDAKWKNKILILKNIFVHKSYIIKRDAERRRCTKTVDGRNVKTRFKYVKGNVVIISNLL